MPPPRFEYPMRASVYVSTDSMANTMLAGSEREPMMRGNGQRAGVVGMLVISVMAVALRYRSAKSADNGRAMVILLLIVLPVMAMVSVGLGWAILGMPAAAALLGAAIRPTDPAPSVVTGQTAERGPACP